MLIPSLQKYSSLRISKNNLLIFLTHSSFLTLAVYAGVNKKVHTSLAVLCFVCCFFLCPGCKEGAWDTCSASRAGQRGTGSASWLDQGCALLSPCSLSHRWCKPQGISQASTREHSQCFSCSDEPQLPCVQVTGILLLSSDSEPSVAALYPLKDIFKAKTCEGLSAFRKSFWCRLLCTPMENPMNKYTYL